MSFSGRLHDALVNILEGYDTSTNFVEGPMYKHPQLQHTVYLLEETFNSFFEEYKQRFINEGRR